MMYHLIDQLFNTQYLCKKDIVSLISGRNPEISNYLFEKARILREKYYGKDIYIRGLVEVSNFCKNDCLYCGIRKSNLNASRYRLNKEQILECCRRGYDVGFRTFVIQGGEDICFNDELLVDMIRSIKKDYPDCAITLSLGERSYESYLALFQAGADRYLLRHETADKAHYQLLHPQLMSHENRIQCLRNLKEIGFQTGSGFMVGSPFQTIENLADDLIFLSEFKPEMVGIGHFITHHETPFADQAAGTVELTLFMLALTRLFLPSALLPTTTALGTVESSGRVRGILAGANVIMPNLSPIDVREKYMIYDNKVISRIETVEYLDSLRAEMKQIGYNIVVARGDYKKL